MKFVSLLLLVLLSGCSSISERSASAVPAHPLIEPWGNWQLEGRISIRNDQDGWFANLHWFQSGDHYQINVRGLLGQGVVELVGDTSQARLSTSDGRVYTNQNPDILLQKMLGAKLPVSGLRYWVHGLAEPHQAEESRWNAEGLRAELRQSGWVIQYKQYVQVEDRWLPVKIRLYNQDYRIQLQIDQWQKNALLQGQRRSVVTAQGVH